MIRMIVGAKLAVPLVFRASDHDFESFGVSHGVTVTVWTLQQYGVKPAPVKMPDVLMVQVALSGLHELLPGGPVTLIPVATVPLLLGHKLG